MGDFFTSFLQSGCLMAFAWNVYFDRVIAHEIQELNVLDRDKVVGGFFNKFCIFAIIFLFVLFIFLAIWWKPLWGIILTIGIDCFVLVRKVGFKNGDRVAPDLYVKQFGPGPLIVTYKKYRILFGGELLPKKGLALYHAQRPIYTCDYPESELSKDDYEYVFSTIKKDHEQHGWRIEVREE